MDALTQIMKSISDLIGAEIGTEQEVNNPLEQKRLDCEFICNRENNREGDLDKYDGHSCVLCHNKGYTVKPVLYLNSYSQVRTECKCMKTRRSIRALKRSGLADIVYDYTLEKYQVTEPWQEGVLKKACDYLQGDSKSWFFFGGTSGCGKTHICTALAIALLKRGNEVKYMLWRDDANRLKALLNEKEYAPEIEAYKSVDVLYIDDLFKTGTAGEQRQRPTNADINLAFEILNARSIRKKITIISSESTLTDIVETDEATGGRIKQNCGEYIININRDRRKNYRLK